MGTVAHQDPRRFLTSNRRKILAARIERVVLNHELEARRAFLDSRAGGRGSEARRGSRESSEESPRRPDEVRITRHDATDIYLTKCRELGLKPNAGAQARFVEGLMASMKPKTICMRGFALGGECISALVRFFVKLNISVLDLALNQAGTIGGSMIGAYLSRNPVLCALDLRSNGIGSDGTRDIFLGLAFNDHLVDLDLGAVDGVGRNRVGNEGGGALCKLLMEDKPLSSLSLAMCGLSRDACELIGRGMRFNTSLTFLDLTSNRIGSGGAAALLAGGSFGAIESLILGRNGIGEGAARAVCAAVAATPTLRVLDLSWNELGPGFLKALGAALSASRVEVLNLAGNQFSSDTCVWPLVQVLASPTLRALDLSHNELGDERVASVFESFVGGIEPRAMRLELLDVSFAGFGNAACKKFGELLLVNKCLRVFRANDNEISDEAAVGLAVALRTNVALQSLSIAGSSVREGFAAALLETLKQNETLRNVNVAYSDFDVETYRDVKLVLARRQRSVLSGSEEAAERYIDWLVGEEKRLFGLRADVRAENDRVEMLRDQRDMTKVSLRDVLDKRRVELAAAQEIDATTQEEMDELDDKRRDAHHELMKLQAGLDERQIAASREAGGLLERQRALASSNAKAKAAADLAAKTSAAKIAALRARVQDLRGLIRGAIGDIRFRQRGPIDEQTHEQTGQARDSVRGKRRRGKRTGRKKAK